MAPSENEPIVSAATAYDDPTTGDTFVLFFNEALYYGTTLDHSLINPNQVRAYGIPFWDNPFDPDRGLSIDIDASLRIHLQSAGTKLMFPLLTNSAIVITSI
ncbi:Reverse transcriptase (RNA-dependent DNA polymerase) [Fragilaria crotonensis]|nr:Reverse transcriptase (RNA-dependent DNA polymerase) [Fragilaria crotonensis]